MRVQPPSTALRLPVSDGQWMRIMVYVGWLLLLSTPTGLLKILQVQASPEVTYYFVFILFAIPPQCRDYRVEPPHLVNRVLGMEPRALGVLCTLNGAALPSPAHAL